MAQFLAAIKNNSEVITILINIAILGVWIFYAQLLYLNYARQRSPRLCINQTRGYGYNSPCLLINMSEESIYVECVMLVVQMSKDSFSQEIATFYPGSEQELFQSQPNPLPSGEYQFPGTFGELLQGSVKEISDQLTIPKEEGKPDWARDIDTLEIRVVAIYGPEKRPVGARRRFSLTTSEDRVRLVPERLMTTQMDSRSQRREVEEWLEQWYMQQ